MQCLQRSLRGCLASIAVLLVCIGVFAAFNWRSASAYVSNLAQLLRSPGDLFGLRSDEDALAYLLEHPSTTALVIGTVQDDGTVSYDMMHNQDAPLPLASTMKIVVLAAYAREVEAGRLDPEERVSVADWERYFLPGTDGGAHAATLEEFGLAVGDDGFAQDQSATVSLDQLARAMIRFSDNAATDYLLARVGPDAMQAVVTDLDVQQHEPILPLIGTFLSWTNHEQPDQSAARRDALIALDDAAYAAEVERLTAAYRDPAWRAAELEWRRMNRQIADVSFQAQLAQARMPRGSAAEYARILAGVASDTLFSPAVSATMRRHLEWPMERAGNQEHFASFGAKGGSVAGVLTDAMYLVPKEGDYANQRRVMVVFFNELPLSAWLSLSQSFAQQDLAVRLATDQAFVEQAQTRLSTVEP